MLIIAATSGSSRRLLEPFDDIVWRAVNGTVKEYGVD